MPMNPRRGFIYAMLALAEAGWIAPVLLSRISHNLTDLTGWFLTLLVIVCLAILLGWVTDVYNVPFEVSRTFGMGLAGLGILILLQATLYPDDAFWRLGWVGEFGRGLFSASGHVVALIWIVIAVGYIWWRCLYMGHTPPEPPMAEFTLHIGFIAFTVLMFFGGFQPAFAPSLLFLLLFGCGSLLAMGLSYTETIYKYHGEGGIGRLRRRLVNNGVIIVLVIVLAVILASVFSFPVLQSFFQIVFSAIGFLLRPLAVVLFWVLSLLEPLFEWLIGVLRSIVADSGVFDSTPEPIVTPELFEEIQTEQQEPAWWTVYTIWAWRVVGILLIIWIFYRFTSKLGRRYKKAPLASEAVTTQEDLLPETPDLGGLWDRGKNRLADLINLVRKFGLGRELRAAATIRRIYAALVALAGQKGLQRAPHQTPLEFLNPLSTTWPNLAEQFTTITNAYVNVHYGQFPEGKAGLEQVRRAWDEVYEAVSGEGLEE
jgi:hypothetical protein